MGKIIDLTDQKFGKWTVIGFAELTKWGSKWKVKCICGEIRFVLAKTLKTGDSLSCGCAFKLPIGEASKNSLYRNYRRGAEKRGLSFSLTKEVFGTLTSACCNYCGATPSAVHRNRDRFYNGNYTYNGIDRVNSELGYEIENCVPCCWTCNRMKRLMGLDDFIEHCHRVSEKHPNISDKVI